MINFKSLVNHLDPFTKSIIGLNLIVYIVSVFKNHTSALTGLSQNQMLQTFGMSGDNGIIPIITSMFSHASLMHFILNMLTLALLSPIVMQHFSLPSYIITYFASGISGNLMTKWIDPSMVTMGASGAIYGIMGMLVVAVISSNFVQHFHGLESMTSIILIIIGVNMFSTFANPHINLIAHLSGFSIGGIVTGIILMKLRKLN